MEASIGIEPIFTDLQSNRFLHKINAQTLEQYQDKPKTYREPDTSTSPGSDFACCDLTKERHKRISRMLCHCLTLQTAEDWRSFSFFAKVRLTVAERASLAYAALNSLDRLEAEMTAAAAIDPAGYATDLGLMGEARLWASYASTYELKGYALACFEAMPPPIRAAFLEYAEGLSA